MSLLTNNTIYTSPLTTSHLRAVLAALRNMLVSLNSQTAAKEATTDATVVAGNVVYVKATGNLGLAQNDVVADALAAGLVTVGAAGAGIAEFISRGRVELADWTAIIGAATLTPGTVYYLSATAGLMTATAPTSTGTVVRCGLAITTTIFDIQIEPGILL